MARNMFLVAIGMASLSCSCGYVFMDSNCDGGGIADGVRVYTYPNGNVRSKTDVVHCLCNGTTMEYRTDGSLMSSGRCEAGQYLGPFTKYDRAGVVVGIEYWRGGNLERVRTFGMQRQLDFYPSTMVITDSASGDSLKLPFQLKDNQYTWFFAPAGPDLFLLTSGFNAFVVTDSLELLFDLRGLPQHAVPKALDLEFDIIQGWVNDHVLEISGFAPLDTALKVFHFPLESP